MEVLFTVSHIENDQKGRLIVGKITKGELKKGMQVSTRRNAKKPVGSTKVKAIFLQGKSVSSVSAEKVSAVIKIELAHQSFDVREGDTIIGKSSSSQTIGFAGEINQSFRGTFVKHEGMVVNPIFTNILNSVKWRNSSSDSLALSLQGGGAKGAFGVGVLKFMKETKLLTPEKKLHLSSASTGSITSVLLSENGPNTIDKAIEQYTSMLQLEDMFKLRQDVKTILQREPTLKKLVGDTFKAGGVPDFDFSVGEFAWEKVKAATKKTLSDTTIWNAPFVSFRFLSNIIGEGSKTIQNAKALMNIEQSLATLTPVVNKLLNSETGIDPDRLENNLQQKMVTLKMAVTSLTSGATCYINEKLELMYPIKGDISDGYDYTRFESYPIVSIGTEKVGHSQSGITARTGLVQAAITSGAFPMFFAPQTIRFTTPNGEVDESFNDGGIRENLPLRILARDKHTNIIAIYCSPIDEGTEKQEKVEKYTWMDVMGRTLSIIDAENMRNDISTGVPVNTFLKGEGDHHVMHIAPTVPTLGLTQIDPLAIKTTIWYGYLRAYDEVFLSEFQTQLGNDYELTKIRLRENSEDIFLCWRALGTLGKNLLRESAYRVPISPGSENFRYVGWYKKFGKLTFPDGSVVDMKTLRNEDKIHYLAFDPDQLHNYLQQKLTLLNLLNIRKDLIKLDPNFIDSFMYGDQGFMKKSFFGDWFGVYETLNAMRITINKRGRMFGIFGKNRFFHAGADLLYKRSIKIYADKEEVPKRISSISATSRFQFARLKSDILANIQKLEQQGVPFEGSMDDSWHNEVVIFDKSDSAFAEKDQESKAFFAG